MDNWKLDIVRGLSERPRISSTWSICKVPRNVRKVNEDAYTPHIVSIGPIHHQDENLLPMEDHKRRYLISLFRRTQNPSAILEDCYSALLGLDDDVRACYLEPILYDKPELAKILLHDKSGVRKILQQFSRIGSQLVVLKRYRLEIPASRRRRKGQVGTQSTNSIVVLEVVGNSRQRRSLERDWFRVLDLQSLKSQGGSSATYNTCKQKNNWKNLGTGGVLAKEAPTIKDRERDLGKLGCPSRLLGCFEETDEKVMHTLGNGKYKSAARNHPLTMTWLSDIEKGLRATTRASSSWSICKVPMNVRSVNEDAYTPHIVSIGPIHHQDKKLSPMEYHKRQYLISLFTRMQDPSSMLNGCLATVIALEEDVRACYVEPIPYDQYELVKILLHDAGFMIELFFRYSEMGLKVQVDPIFTTSWMISTLQRDLTLLENQIPLFVLKSVFERIAPSSAAGLPTLEELALQFFKSTLNISEEAFLTKCRQKGNHLLHLLHNCYLPSNPIDSRSKLGAWEFIHSATSLRQAGVVFQKNTTNDLFDLQFHNGTFKIPPLRIHGSTDTLFRNLVAFEQCHQDNKQYITSYIMLMDRLIDTTNDVELLQQKRIIDNALGGGDDVSNMLNNICKQIVLKEFYFAGLCNQINAYTKSPWHRYKATLRRDYFKNPWSIMSFVAAVLLIVLTLLQTLYSVLSYYKN
ncbi:UPF0481 protein At3g47200-like [Tripterygium wilfordii]|uniref:UPF0481 protein At3g47200-like n=1 Tax=Tripterygium wilfordii TaxID=458696 RepID=UPI0018F8608B|nr:UPF0481 protein At3g47200-like [Tripterygium wilfordii]